MMYPIHTSDCLCNARVCTFILYFRLHHSATMRQEMTMTNDNYSVAGVYTDFHKEHTNTNNANAQLHSHRQIPQLLYSLWFGAKCRPFKHAPRLPSRGGTGKRKKGNG